MFDDLKWRRGSGELSVIDAFSELARKASEEAHADVMVVLKFPQGYRTVIASTHEDRATPPRTWTAGAVAKGLHLLSRWLRDDLEGEATEIREELDRLKSSERGGQSN